MVAPKTTSATSGTKVIRCRRRLRESLCIIYHQNREALQWAIGGNLTTGGENFFNFRWLPGVAGQKSENDREATESTNDFREKHAPSTRRDATVIVSTATL